MVVDTAARRVLAWPYNKFWNHGETLADAIDWRTARVQEKLDGSLMILYWDPGLEVWSVASSGTPDAGGSFGSSEELFRHAFWRVANESGVVVLAANRNITYMLELCDVPNRIVVRHEKPRLVLHGARYLESGRELTQHELELEARRMRLELVLSFPLASIADVLAAAEALDPLQQEGFVVVDANHNRVKVKSPRYVILHHLKGEMSTRRAIELWITGEASELLASFPEFAADVERVHGILDAIAGDAVRDFHDNYPRPTRKEFALAVKDKPHAAVLFQLLSEETRDLDAAKRIMRRMSLAALERLVES